MFVQLLSEIHTWTWYHKPIFPESQHYNKFTGLNYEETAQMIMNITAFEGMTDEINRRDINPRHATRNENIGLGRT